jgi:serine/threonine protein kinase/tetratricopeptide (TPR) repeat protein
MLGRFQLLEPLAQGGMASVWRAVHRDQGVPAAVKVLTHRFGGRELADALRAEIRAVALLNHPRIVSVFDQGEVDAKAAAASRGVLQRGSPWVALELVEGGTLSTLYKDLQWPTLHRVLQQLLDALAHAHAAGVVHRDIKLANVLVSTRQAGIKLTDFGIAYAMRSHEDGTLTEAIQAGTPRYMAPEQIHGRLAEQGPWTDLYAVGVMAWRLASGLSPFPDDDEAGLVAKAKGEFAPFHARFPVPDGFPGWCARLMRPSPAERFAAAADALFSLDRLGPAPSDPPTQPTVIGVVPPPQPLPLIEPPAVPAPLPRTWRTTDGWRRPVELVGCGLRLFGLRGGQVVGRMALRDSLWDSLLAVHADGRPRVVVLRGPSGYGKSSLAGWIGRRAEEVGGGVALRTSWEEDAHAGLAGMISRRLRCVGANATVLRAQITAHLGRSGESSPREARLLLQLLAPSEARKGEPDVEPSGPRALRQSAELGQEERFELVTRAIARLARMRPAVVHFDDAHANPEAFAFPRALLDRTDAPPVLFVLTVQEEAIAGNHAARSALAALTAHPRSRVLSVGALPLEDQVDFVQGLLRLEPGLAARVAKRTEGNPLFASQLLDDWVSRDLLELSVDGFRLKNPLDASLPGSLADVWHRRVEALLEATHPHFRVPLEIAAALGSAVDTAEWLAICRRAGWTAPTSLVDELLARHLAVVEGEGQWRFVHGMLREAILKSAGASGRLQSHHRAVAEHLVQRGGAAVRIGRHLLQAHAGAEAIDPLEEGAEQATASGDYDEALHLLRARAALLRGSNVPRSDERWGRGWVAQAELLARLDRYEESAALARQACAEAREHDWPRVEVEALMLLVENRSATDLPGAQSLLERAYEVAVQPGSEDTLAAVCLLASQVARRSGDLEGALHHAKQALQHVLTHGGLRRSRCEVELAQTLIKLGRLDEARRHVDRAEQLSTRHDQRFDAAVCAYLRAAIGRARGDLTEAKRGYRDATDHFTALGDGNAWAMRAHLGLVLAEQGSHDEARRLFQQVLASSSQVGDLLAHLGSLLSGADDVDPQAFRDHAEAVKRFVDRGWCDPLVARVLDLAANRSAKGWFPPSSQGARALVADPARPPGVHDHEPTHRVQRPALTHAAYGRYDPSSLRSEVWPSGRRQRS